MSREWVTQVSFGLFLSMSLLALLGFVFARKRAVMRTLGGLMAVSVVTVAAYFLSRVSEPLEFQFYWARWSQASEGLSLGMRLNPQDCFLFLTLSLVWTFRALGALSRRGWETGRLSLMSYFIGSVGVFFASFGASAAFGAVGLILTYFAELLQLLCLTSPDEDGVRLLRRRGLRYLLCAFLWGAGMLLLPDAGYFSASASHASMEFPWVGAVLIFVSVAVTGGMWPYLQEDSDPLRPQDFFVLGVAFALLRRFVPLLERIDLPIAFCVPFATLALLTALGAIGQRRSESLKASAFGVTASLCVLMMVADHALSATIGSAFFLGVAPALYWMSSSVHSGSPLWSRRLVQAFAAPLILAVFPVIALAFWDLLESKPIEAWMGLALTTFAMTLCLRLLPLVGESGEKDAPGIALSCFSAGVAVLLLGYREFPEFGMSWIGSLVKSDEAFWVGALPVLASFMAWGGHRLGASSKESLVRSAFSDGLGASVLLRWLDRGVRGLSTGFRFQESGVSRSVSAALRKVIRAASGGFESLSKALDKGLRGASDLALGALEASFVRMDSREGNDLILLVMGLLLVVLAAGGWLLS